MEKGSPDRLGCSVGDGGTNFALFSEVAERVELCLFNDAGVESRRDLPACTDGIWHGFLPCCDAGQHYGYRIHGPYEPDAGLRCNPHKLLIDPYARGLSGDFDWQPPVFDYVVDDHRIELNELDSAPNVPKSVVTVDPRDAVTGPKIAWADMVVYEANVRGYTMRHPGLSAEERGRFCGMRNGAILQYLKSLGVTSIELMPVHAFIDEQALVRRGLRNFWGYNTVNFFTPMARYAAGDPRSEFVEMVNAIHDAGLEVILDVVYNHTAESDRFGPSLSFRGIDNLAYYRTEPDAPSTYVNDTGCGNTINGDHPIVRRLIVDSLVYWSRSLGADGFRFDLAPVLGRHGDGFSADHPLLAAIAGEAALRDVKLIAEPWDPGPGGYQLGQFPRSWAEWNDRYRDAVRRFWRGDRHMAGEFARRIHGSADLFESSGRGPTASVNFVAAHDGFTLADLVSYNHRHNDANGEDNDDGHAHNFSHNHGIEGTTADAEVNTSRRQQRLNMLATVLISHGTPMLLAGDEFGNSQGGNNNAYAQDNETGWLDWSGAEADPDFVDRVRDLVSLRRRNSLCRPDTYQHGHGSNAAGWRDVEWFDASGRHLNEEDWHHTSVLSMILLNPDRPAEAIAIVFNASDKAVELSLPEYSPDAGWRLVLHTAVSEPQATGVSSWALAASTVSCFELG